MVLVAKLGALAGAVGGAAAGASALAHGAVDDDAIGRRRESELTVNYWPPS